MSHQTSIIVRCKEWERSVKEGDVAEVVALGSRFELRSYPTGEKRGEYYGEHPQWKMGARFVRHLGKGDFQTLDAFVCEAAARVMSPGHYTEVYLRGDHLVLQQQGVPIGEVSAIGWDEWFTGYWRTHFRYAVYVRDGLFQIVRFVQLHAHSGFSLLDGGNSIRSMIQHAEYASALTDHGYIHGAIRFYKQMKRAGKQPILGMEAYAETMDGQRNGNHLLLLARTYEGFQHLVQLTTRAQHQFYRYPHVSYADLEELGQGLISSTTCLGSEVNQHLLRGAYEQAKDVMKQQMAFFGQEHYYVELQRHGQPEEVEVNRQLIELSKELGLRLIATSDAHYPTAQHQQANEVLLCIGTKTTLANERRMKLPGSGYHLENAREMEEKFFDVPEAIQNTVDVARQCQSFSFPDQTYFMPDFPIPSSFSSTHDYFMYLCMEGFRERFEGTAYEKDPTYIERLRFEIASISKMGFESYFLIVWDFIRYARQAGIAVGPGRGSVVGSLLAYCLRITNVNPIPFDLLFERFLNPDRISMPDIDIDFEDHRRDEVIRYVEEKYRGQHGVEHVCKIITFGSLSARSVLRDVARVLGHEPSFVDRLAKAVPKQPKITLQTAYEESDGFRQLLQQQPDFEQVFNYALQLEGLPRNPSIHACGVIIAPGRLEDHIPQRRIVQKEKGSGERVVYVSQWDKDDVEEQGYLKMDFLGLRTLGVLSDVGRLVNERRQIEGKTPIDPFSVPVDDPAVYRKIAAGQSYGVFQLESPGMRKFMMQLYANVTDETEPSMELFERLIAGISLFRPGPLEYIPQYLQNLAMPDTIQYDHEQLKERLQTTYGVIVYQEQTMYIVQDMAGFTKGEADEVRKVFAKKLEDKIESLGQKFMERCEERGVKKETAQLIWSKMAKFGRYAFNKSHATAYAYLSAMTAWFFHYYPVEFMTAVLNSFVQQDTKIQKVRLYLSALRKLGIPLYPPDVNRSDVRFTVEGNGIRFGLKALKSVGVTSEQIVRQRERGGRFLSFEQFLTRMIDDSGIRSNVVDALIYSGGLDSVEPNRTRRGFLEVKEKWMDEFAKERKTKRQIHPDQLSLFSDEEWKITAGYVVPDMPEMDKLEKLGKEYEVAGFFITEHPLDEYRSLLKGDDIHEIGYFVADMDDEQNDDRGEELGVEGVSSDIESWIGQEIRIAGIVMEVQERLTKRKKVMKIVTVEDGTGSMECIVFPEQVQVTQGKLHEGAVVVVTGTFEVDAFGSKVIVKHVVDIEAIHRNQAGRLWIHAWTKEDVDFVCSLIRTHPGSVPVCLQYEKQAVQLEGLLALTLPIYTVLETRFGERRLKMVYPSATLSRPT